MAWRVCFMVYTVAGSVKSLRIVQGVSPFGNDFESKWQVKGHEKAPKPLGFRGLAHLVTLVCFQWFATPCNTVISCASLGVVSGDFPYLTWGYSHSIVAASICMVFRFSSCRLVRLLSRNPNHFVITGVITNLLNSDLTAAFRNDSLAITPRNTNGDDDRWFAMA